MESRDNALSTEKEYENLHTYDAEPSADGHVHVGYDSFNKYWLALLETTVYCMAGHHS